MPHYVTTDEQGGTEFYIFSTISMGAISPRMTAEEMLTHLQKNDYSSWLDPRSWNEQIAADPTIPQRERTPEQEAWAKIIEIHNDEYTYWHPLGFWYVTEDDGYFV